MLLKLIYRLKRLHHFLKTALLCSLPAQIKYRFPAKKIKTIAVTGTDGKTTTSTLIYNILNQAGKKTGLISTVAAKVGNKDTATGLHVTVPRPWQLHKLLKQMVEQSCEYAVLEVTSHGVYQFRIWGIWPIIAGLTNVSHEHFDYHLDYDTYIEAKSLLLQKAPVVFLNEDDRSFYRMKQHLDLKKQQVYSYSADNQLPAPLEKAIKKRFSEPYNQMNARLAVRIAQQLEIDQKHIIQALKKFKGVAGRMEEVRAGQPFKVYVDFAHTPNALDNSLGALRDQLDAQKKAGKLIAVFGSAGFRDRSKRPKMGQVAAKHADLVIITADDPRTENLWTIIQQIKSGAVDQIHKIISIADRRKALEFALTELAEPNDIVGLMGKGAEQSLAIGKDEIPWDDRKNAAEILNKKYSKNKS